MTEAEINERNKAIAIYLGWIVMVNHRPAEWDTPACISVKSCIKNTDTYDLSQICYKESEIEPAVIHAWNELLNLTYGKCGRFHRDWKDLMPIVEKIITEEQTDLTIYAPNIMNRNTFGSYIDLHKGDSESMIQSLWMAVSNYCIDKIKRESKANG